MNHLERLVAILYGGSAIFCLSGLLLNNRRGSDRRLLALATISAALTLVGALKLDAYESGLVRWELVRVTAVEYGEDTIVTTKHGKLNIGSSRVYVGDEIGLAQDRGGDWRRIPTYKENRK